MLAIYPVKNEIIDLILDNYSKQFQSMFVFHTALEYRSSFAKAADLKMAVDLLIGLIAWTGRESGNYWRGLKIMHELTLRSVGVRFELAVSVIRVM